MLLCAARQPQPKPPEDLAYVLQSSIGCSERTAPVSCSLVPGRAVRHSGAMDGGGRGADRRRPDPLTPPGLGSLARYDGLTSLAAVI